jgi:ketosteroid isomerase-like protein
MSEQANIELVQKIYADYLKGDVSAVLSGMADDIEFHQLGPSSTPTAGVHKGHAGLRKFFDTVRDDVEFSEFDVQEYFAKGDRVVALGHYGGRVKSTNKQVSSPFAMAWTIENGKAIALTEYLDSAAMAEGFRPEKASTAP